MIKSLLEAQALMNKVLDELRSAQMDSDTTDQDDSIQGLLEDADILEGAIADYCCSQDM